MTSCPLPVDIGLPFNAWRPGQWELLCKVLDSDANNHVVVAPTGFGKSLLYMAAAQLIGGKTVILTSTKALQDQLMKDFATCGLYDVRGKTAYPCVLPDKMPDQAHMVRGNANCGQAPCNWGFRCPLRDSSGCIYYDRVNQAKLEPLVVTNYSFWLYQDIGDVDLLIMDEAHAAPDELADWLSIRLTKDMRKYFAGRMPEVEDMDVWKEWLNWANELIHAKLERYMNNPPDELIKLGRELKKMELLEKGEWVVDIKEDGGVDFDCIAPSAHGASLWGRAKKVFMVSATANKATAAAIGLESPQVWEAASNFPIERRRVWAISGAVQVNYRMEEAHKRMWVALIDRLLAPRMDRKGIIHTTSFERAKYLQTYSKFAHKLVLNESRNTKDTVYAFKSSPTPMVLVSPSVTTGYDFPYSQCEFQIIGKIPFPDLRSKVNQIRSKRNRDWAGYMAAQQIIQSSGRGMRAVDDQCETFIADGNFDWWYKDNRKFIPKWWQESVAWADTGHLPEPLTPLKKFEELDDDDIPF